MRIETIAGPIAAEELGPTLMHEHLLALAPPGFYSGGDPNDLEELVPRALASLSHLGIKTVVDLSGAGRASNGADDFRRLQRLGSKLPFHIVAGFSFYKDPWLAMSTEDDLDQMTSRYLDAATASVNGVRVGIFGEVGTSLDRITPREEVQLRAVARAHLKTGLAISTHCTLGTMALEQAGILADEGADLRRVVLGHLDLLPDLGYLEKVLATGANIGFDTFGKEWFDYRVPGSEGQGSGSYVKWTYRRSDDERVDALAELCARGYDDRIVLSCDMSGAEAYLNPSTHGRYGHSFLHSVVLPRLKNMGVSESSLHRMLVENPSRILAMP
ncbi:MAG TPA: aryldialkylphosphatase [Acidimicrobiia bacterium]|nr:aryldialkylphosphatase [Acidimicrobiia bacterium]